MPTPFAMAIDETLNDPQYSRVILEFQNMNGDRIAVIGARPMGLMCLLGSFYLKVVRLLFSNLMIDWWDGCNLRFWGT